MRPNYVRSLLVLLSVAVFAHAELRPTGAPENSDTPIQVNLSSNYYNLTFEDYKQRYHKEYSSLAEEEYRRFIFQKNLDDLNNHNSNPSRSFNMKPNAFLDVSQDQFKEVFATVHAPDLHSKNVTSQITRQYCQNHSCKSHRRSISESNPVQKVPQTETISNSQSLSSDSSQQPTRNPIENGRQGRLLQTISIETNTGTKNNITQGQSNSLKTQGIIEDVRLDWSPYSGSVRFQGFCGACYAFSTVDTVSAHLAINRFGFFYQLSVQQIIDCTDNGLTFGCRGGYLEGALTQIQMKGIVSQSSYPFTSGSRGFEGSCKVQAGSFKVKSFSTIQEGNCAAVLTDLKRGPVSAGISGYNLRFYDSGIFNQCKKTDQLDHAIVIVGYTSGKGWLIKNSWGVDWGQKGYGWIAEGNTCGICNMTVSLTV